MTTDFKKALIVYCSPAGTTRQVAQMIAKCLENLSIEVTLFDLGEERDHGAVLNPIKTARNMCLFIGSPVYVSHAVPPVMNFIENLPENTKLPAVPFVTWGAVTSGIALYEMGRALQAKGMNVMGAAKVAAVHSMMWQSDNPLGEGHPDSNDRQMLTKLVGGVVRKLTKQRESPMRLSDLRYQPKPVQAEMEKISLAAAKERMPQRVLDKNLCTHCEICAEVCPTDAVSFSPYPEFGAQCIFCFNCMRKCPEGAIKADFTQVEKHIRLRAEQLNERPLTQIFL
jgi:ferredoxin/flavodoxin